MSDDRDPFSGLFNPPFFNPTIVVSIPGVFSSLLAGINSLPASPTTQPPQTTQPPPTSTVQPSTLAQPPIRKPLDAQTTSSSSTTHSPISLPPTSTPPVDATTVLFNITNILTETSLLTAPAPPSASAASLTAEARTLPQGAIAGIVVAVLSGAALVALALVLLLRRRRARRRQERAVPHPSSPLLFRCAGAESPLPPRIREKPASTPEAGSSGSPTVEAASTSTSRSTRNPRESVVDMSYVSDDHLPLMHGGPSSPRGPGPRRVARRERDGGLVHPSLYLDTSFEQFAGQSVEYLPPAYEDLPPSPLSPVVTTPMTHG